MLVLTRKKGESIVIDNHTIVTILDTEKGRCKVGIEAPDYVTIRRSEVTPRNPPSLKSA